MVYEATELPSDIGVVVGIEYVVKIISSEANASLKNEIKVVEV